MIYLVKGDTVTCDSRIIRVGMPVKAMFGVPLYGGLYGTVACVKTGKDRETDSEAPEVYVKFDFPQRPQAREVLLRRFEGKHNDVFDAVRDWVRIEPNQFIPSVDFCQMVRHPKTASEYIVYTDSHCQQVATNVEYTWPYREFHDQVEPVPLESVDTGKLIAKLCSRKERHFIELAYQIEDAVWEMQYCASLTA